MHASEALLAVERLVRLVEKGPGRDDAAAREVRAIVESLEDYSSEPYFTKRLNSMFRTFETWLSPPSWAPSGNDADFLRSILDEELRQLRFAMQSVSRAKRKQPLAAFTAKPVGAELRV